jgi:hypothetical protein
MHMAKSRVVKWGDLTQCTMLKTKMHENIWNDLGWVSEHKVKHLNLCMISSGCNEDLNFHHFRKMFSKFYFLLQIP